MWLPGGWTTGLLVAVCALIYWKMKERFKFFEKRGIPFIEPVFLLGSNVKGNLLLQSFSENWMTIYKGLKGHKLGGIFQFTMPLYVVRDPEYIMKIFVSDFSHFHDRGIKIDEELNPLEGHLFFLPGQKWKYLRNKLSPIFTSGKLKWMYEEMYKCGDMFMKHFETLSNGKELDCKEDLARFTTDVIGSCAFGFDSESLKNPDSKFRIFGRKIFEPSIIQTGKFIARTSFPDLFIKLKIRTGPTEINEFFINIIKQAFEHRISTGSHRKDIIQLLLQLREKGSIDMEKDDDNDQQNGDLTLSENFKIQFSDELLSAQSFVFFVAGFETTSTTMYFTLYLLSKHQKVQNKLREEVRRVKEKHGGFTYDALKDMDYLENCISETLRLYPPVPHHFRECTKDYTFPNGMKIYKGDQVIIPIYAIQRDPEHFPDPDAFIPERFDNPPVPGTYSPFGEGPRVCIGKRFAMMEMKMALARVIDNFSLGDSGINQEPVKFCSTTFVLTPKEGLNIRIQKLKD